MTPVRNIRLTYSAFFIFIALTQVLKLLFFFSNDLANIFNQAPLYHIDYPGLAGQMQTARAFFAENGQLWGYDPFYLSGYMLTFLWNSSVFLQILAILFSSADTFLILKLCLFTIIILEPIFIYVSLRLYKISHYSALLSTFLLLLLLKVGFASLFLASGLLTGYLVFLCSLLASAILFHFISNPFNLRTLIFLALHFAFSLLVHKTFVILALPMAAFSIFYLWRQNKRKHFYGLLLAGAICLLANLFWILPALTYRHLIDWSFNPFLRGISDLVEFAHIFTEGQLAISSITLFTLTICALATFGLYRAYKFQKWLFYFWLTWFSSICAIIALSSFDLISGLHGARFLLCTVIFMIVPAAFGLSSFTFSYLRSFTLPISALFFLAALTLPNIEMNLKKLFKERIPLFDYKENLAITEVKELAAWLQKNTSSEDNIFIEAGYHIRNMQSLLHFYSDRRFISSFYDHAFLKQNYINRYFQDFFNAKREKHYQWPNSAKFAHADLDEVVKLFNVRWFVAYSLSAQNKLAQQSNFRKAATLGQYEIYTYTKPSSNFILGRGEIAFKHNRIRVSNNSAQPRVILNLHWSKGLKVNGAQKIRAHFKRRFPLPFIEIVKPEKKFEIYL